MSRLFLFIMISYALAASCKNRQEAQIIGEWRREIQPNIKEDIDFANTGWGDVTFSPDSTFFIQGDTTQQSTNDTVPGWHSGSSVKGTWRLEQGYVALYLEDWAGTAFHLRYRIVELSKKRLVLLSTLDGNDTTRYIHYSKRK